MVGIILTDIKIPDSVRDILKLGKGFSSMVMNCRSRQVIAIIKDVQNVQVNVEANIDKIPRSDQQHFRNKVLHLSKSFTDKFCLHKSSTDRKIEQGILAAKNFLKDNSD